MFLYDFLHYAYLALHYFLTSLKTFGIFWLILKKYNWFILYRKIVRKQERKVRTDS